MAAPDSRKIGSRGEPAPRKPLHHCFICVVSRRCLRYLKLWGFLMRGKVSTIGWSSEWGALDSRRPESLSKMMAFSLVLHFCFLIFLFFGRSFWGTRPAVFQSYQVNLVAPGSMVASSPQGGASTGGTAPVARKTAEAGSPRLASAPAAPAPTAVRSSIPTPTRAPKAEPKEDPERLQEWWKKAAKSIKAPPAQPDQQATPFKEAARVDLTKRQIPSQPVSPQPISPAAPPTGGSVAGTGKGGEEGAADSAGGGSGQAGSAQAGVNPQAGAGQGGPGHGLGVATGKASFDGPLFQFPSYLQNMENKISGKWSPPAVSMQGEVGAVIQFKVRKDGRVESIEVEKSSGNIFFDQAAMRAIFGAAPLPPLPEDLNEDRLTVHFSFMVQKGS